MKRFRLEFDITETDADEFSVRISPYRASPTTILLPHRHPAPLEPCEKCGGTLKIVSALSSPEQDDVIRAILESKGQWNPPWDRRGPPPHRAPGSTPSEPTVEYDVDLDPLWPED